MARIVRFALLAAFGVIAAARRARRRTPIRRARCASSCRSRPARAPTCCRGCSPTSSPANGAVPSSRRTSPGASGNIGAFDVWRSAPDGHTMMLAPPGPIATNRFLFKEMTYDSTRWVAGIVADHRALRPDRAQLLQRRPQGADRAGQGRQDHRRACPDRAAPRISRSAHLRSAGRHQVRLRPLQGARPRHERYRRRSCRHDVRHARPPRCRCTSRAASGSSRSPARSASRRFPTSRPSRSPAIRPTARSPGSDWWRRRARRYALADRISRTSARSSGARRSSTGSRHADGAGRQHARGGGGLLRRRSALLGPGHQGRQHHPAIAASRHGRSSMRAAGSLSAVLAVLLGGIALGADAGAGAGRVPRTAPCGS